jgi:hypothetical protein
VPDHQRRDGWWLPRAVALDGDGHLAISTWKGGGVRQGPLYIKLSDEIGDWGGDITQAKLPDKFLVDYVRA